MAYLKKSVLPPHPLISLADLARMHEREYAANVGKSYARDSAHDNLHGAALLMAFFELIDSIELDDKDTALLRSKYEEYITTLAMTYAKDEDDG